MKRRSKLSLSPESSVDKKPPAGFETTTTADQSSAADEAGAADRAAAFAVSREAPEATTQASRFNRKKLVTVLLSVALGIASVYLLRRHLPSNSSLLSFKRR